MLLTVTHAKVSEVPDGADPALVQPSDWNDNHTVSVTLVDEVTNIDVATTLTVAPSGADFTTIAAALNSLRKKTIADNATVTISLSGNVFNEAINIEHPDAKRISIKGVGENLSITGITSSSGAAGNWTYVLSVSSVGNATPGDYLLVRETPVGGVSPNRIVGALKIASVGVGELTVTSLSRHAAAASGAVTASARLVRTVVTSNGPTLNIVGRAMGSSIGIGGRAIDDIVFECITGDAAIKVGDGAVLISDCANVGAVNTSTGVGVSVDCGDARLPGITVSGGITPVSVENGGRAVLSGATVCGGSTAGAYAIRRGFINLAGARLTGGVTGMYAGSGSHIYGVGLIFNDFVTSAASPAVNTVGNDNSYNDT